MRRTLARAGLALLTAGTLGMARPSLAQQSKYLGAQTTSTASKERADAQPYPTVKQHQATSEEIKVELAWLADPLTFPCPLSAYQDAGSLKIRGMVPTEAAKRRAMEIAGEHTTLALINEMRLYPTLPLPAAGVPGNTILRDAAKALAKQLGEKANPLLLTASPSGEVVVTGTLQTLEDQLAVSRCLCGINGCTSVKNKITLSETAPSLPVVATHAKPEPTRMDTSAQPRVMSFPTSTANPAGTEISRFQPAGAIVTLPPSARTSKPSQPLIISTPRESAKSATPTGKTVVLPSAPNHVVAPLSEANEPVATTATRTIPLTGSDAGSGGVRKAVDALPTPVAKTALTAEAPHVACGVISYEDVGPAPISRSEASCNRLKERIESLCGAGRNVEVHFLSGNRLAIKLQCASREEGERNSKKILEMRELAPYEVMLDVKLAP